MPPLNANTIIPTQSSSFLDSDMSDQLTPSNHKTKKSVNFGSVLIREYVRTVGDHPDCKEGPPITIGWEYIEMPPQDLEAFEETQTRRNIHLSSIKRKEILVKEYGVAKVEIRRAEMAVQETSRLRYFTVTQSKAEERAEVIFQSAKRKLKRALSFNNRGAQS